MARNIFDDQVFFENYMELRNREDNYNVLLEQPAMLEVLPEMQGKAVLDLGCGYGDNCRDFIERGARRAVGVDISERMLNAAERKGHSENICFIHMDMSRISELQEKFDVVYSSLAFHYIKNFSQFAKDIYALLNNDGELLFSQEHPIATATVDGLGHYNMDEAGNAVSYTMADYGLSGKRIVHWFVDGVEKYHRTLSEIINALANAGFIITEMVEPLPSKSAVEILPGLKKEFIKPSFLIIKARKGSNKTKDSNLSD